jgi:hypothetical protein
MKRIDVDVGIEHLDISFLKRLTGTLFLELVSNFKDANRNILFSIFST